MNQERERERQEARASREAEAVERRAARERIEHIKRELFALFGRPILTAAGRRSKAFSTAYLMPTASWFVNPSVSGSLMLAWSSKLMVSSN